MTDRRGAVGGERVWFAARDAALAHYQGSRSISIRRAGAGISAAAVSALMGSVPSSNPDTRYRSMRCVILYSSLTGVKTCEWEAWWSGQGGTYC